jgi:hypothetical protein
LLLYGNNSFVALPQNMSDSCYVSKDGITWTAVQTGWRDRPRYGNFLDGEFLVYGPNGDIWGSTEGAYWYRNAQISSPIRQVVKGPGGFLAVREANPLDQDECPILSAPSINGPWNPVRKYNPTRRFNDVAYGDRKFVAVGDGIAISEDGGETWSSTTILGRDPPFQYVAFGAHAFVATGSVQSSNTLAYSADGKAWVHSQFKDLSAIDCVAFGAGRFVAVGKLDANHNAVITSTDGRVWSAPDTIKDCVYNNFVYFVNGKFLVWEACGDSFQTSPDGLTWTEVKPPSGLGGNLVYGNGKYVSSAGTGVRASIDLTNWKDSMLAPYSGTTQGVGFGFGKFIVVGDAGMIHFSDDGENWIRDSSTQFYSLNLQAVAIGEDRIVAVGTNGTVLVSLQGEAGLGPKVSRIAGQPPGFAPALRFHRGRMGVQHQGREFGMDGRRFLEIPSLISGGDEPSRRGGARNTR